jgi:hypothetical protein
VYSSPVVFLSLRRSALVGLVFLGGSRSAAADAADSPPVDVAAIRAQLTPEEFAEYQRWVALGVGGLPPTLEGYRTLQKLNRQLRHPLDVSHLASMMGAAGDRKALDLPMRTGTRPVIAPFAIPHRQTDQHNSEAIRAKQKAIFEAAVARNTATVQLQRSYFETHHDAIFLRDVAKGNGLVVADTHGEVGHMHPSDGSMHFSLSPSDTAEVLKKGWGELHGLAGQVYKPNARLPATYTMIYSPRTDEELAVIERIIEAAIRFSSLH